MNTQKPPLPLHEETLLLALRDDSGTADPYANLGLGLGAAVLAELLLQERVAIETEGKKQFLRLIDDSTTGNTILDAAIGKMWDAKRRAQLVSWVQRFSAIPRLMHRTAESLCAQGVLKVEEGRVLWIFKRTIYPELDGRVEKEILERLRKAIFTQTSEISARTVVLASIANSTGLLRANFDKRKLKERKVRIEKLVKGEIAGKAATEAVEAATAAIAMAVVMSAVILPTVSSS
ncbi:MAG: GOLPH3/VPS74 family protein [Planctomycetota bacterium]